MGFIQEFKEFALKGNLVDMAVAVVMGGAFGKVTSAFIDGMVMPAIGLITGGTDFKEMKVVLKEGKAAVMEAGKEVSAAVPEVAVKYGSFISEVITFLVVALVVFSFIKAMNAMRKKQEAEAAAAPPPPPPAQEVLLTEIRDLLKKK